MQKNFSLVWKNTLKENERKLLKTNINSESDFLKKIICASNDIKDQKIVIKLDSSIIANSILLENFAENINIISLCGAYVVIVHDFNNILEDSFKNLGIDSEVILEKNSINYKNIKIIEMILTGYINRTIVSKLCEAGLYAVGICGKDANLMQAKKSKSLTNHKIHNSLIGLNFINYPIVVNPEILLSFEDSCIIPVITPVACDENNNTSILNVNATASVIANAICADHLVFSCDESLVLNEGIKAYDEKTVKVISGDNQSYQDQGLFSAALNSLHHGTNTVHFINALKFDSLLHSFFPKKLI